jgi:hypothetical protein
VFLTFSVIEPPSITSEEDLDRVADVEAVAVAKLVLTPEFAEAALKALSLHLKKSSE